MSDHKKETDNCYRRKADSVIKELPEFVQDYFMMREIRLSPRSVYTYAGILRHFLIYISEHLPLVAKKNISEIGINDLDKINEQDVVRYLHDLTNYKAIMTDGSEKFFCRSQNTIRLYITVLDSLWKYLVARRMVGTNPLELINRVKIPKREVVCLNKKNCEILLNAVKTGKGLTERQIKYHEINGLRDYTILKLFLSTGIRVSELVGIDISDIDFEKHCINIYRKGGNFDRVFFSDSSEDCLMQYMEARARIYSPQRNELALFLNRNGQRIGTRCVQYMVKKYILASVPAEAARISPHKLRSTYAKIMLNETGGDLERVQKLLGHASIISTTHYVSSTEEEKAAVRNLTDF